MNLENIWNKTLGKDTPDHHTPRQAVENILEQSQEIHPLDALQKELDTLAQYLRDVQDLLQQLRIQQQDAPKAMEVIYNQADPVPMTETWEYIGTRIRELQPLVIRINSDIKELQEKIIKISNMTRAGVSDN